MRAIEYVILFALISGTAFGQAGALPAFDIADVHVRTPTAALSLFDAVNQQLGLKLELRKRPMPVLVVDHIDEKPTEN
ncbi:MAG: TIGR03435 family protein [Acidobacteriota bacterium]